MIMKKEKVKEPKYPKTFKVKGFYGKQKDNGTDKKHKKT